MKTLDEFKSIGGLSGTGTTHETYDGPPRPYNEKFSTKLENVLPGHHHSSTTGTSHTTGTHGTTGALGTTGTHGTTGNGFSSHDSHSSRPDSGYGANEKHNKPSLADKLNPKTDADRDGKAGIMD